MSTVIVSNPRRRKRRTKKKTSTRKTRRKASTRKRSVRRRRSPVRSRARKTTRRRTATVARKTRRRRTTRRAPSRRGFVNQDLVFSAGAVAGGIVATNYLVDRVPGTFSSGGYGRVATKAGIAVLGGMLVAKFGSKSLGTSFATAGLASAALDLVGQMRGTSFSGLGMTSQQYAMRAVPYGGGGGGYRPLNPGMSGSGYSDAEIEAALAD